MRNHEDESNRRGLNMRTINAVFAAIALIIAAALFLCSAHIKNAYDRMERANERYLASTVAAMEMNAGSDYLTDRIRCFTVTGELRYMDDYFMEVNTTRRRDRALEKLGELLGGSGSVSYARLSASLDLSNSLMRRECLAMRLMQAALGLEPDQVPEAVSAVSLSPEESALSREAQQARAQSLVFDSKYMEYKTQIDAYVKQCTEALIHETGTEQAEAASDLSRVLLLQSILTIALLLVGLGLIVFVTTQVRIPLTNMVRLMQDRYTVPPAGAEELRLVARTYNEIHEENRNANQSLTYEATHDALTGVYNRRAYDMFMQSVDLSHAALIIIDVDCFKTINDSFGHHGGDKVLCRVSELLQHSFRSVDMICRIGGDEFVIIMTRVNSSMRGLVADKIIKINDKLQHPDDDTPKASLSVGVAFSDLIPDTAELFKEADAALYVIKNSTKCGCRFAGMD